MQKNNCFIGNIRPFVTKTIAEHTSLLTINISPHIKEFAKYLGADRFYEMGAEYQEFADERHILSVKKAKQALAELVETLS